MALRESNRHAYPAFHNAPVPSFGGADAPLLIVGMAPGLKGANATGRPFTNDGAGDLLYPALLASGFATGTYGRRADDGLALVDCRITNAVKCVPPQNKPLPVETRTCRQHFFLPEVAAMTRLRAVLALGTVSHNTILSAFGLRLTAYKFVHGATHQLRDGVRLFDSYHCSRYNVNTGLLTMAMFQDVFGAIRGYLD